MNDQQERILNLSPMEYTCLAQGYLDRGDAKLAFQNADDAVFIMEDNFPTYRNTDFLARGYQVRANVFAKLDRQKESRKDFKKAIAVAKRLEKTDRLVDCYIDQGAMETEYSETRKAMRRYKKALRLLEKQPQSELLQKVYYHMGAACYKNNDFKKAEKYWLESEQNGGKQEYLAYALGSVYMKKRSYEQSLNYFLRCKELRETRCAAFPYHADLAEIYMLLGDVYTLAGLPVKAVKQYILVLKRYEVIYKDDPKNPRLRDLYAKLVQTYDALGEKQNAEAYAYRLRQAR